MQLLLAVLMFVVSLSANAGFFATDTDGCSDYRESNKVGDELMVELKVDDIDSNGMVQLSSGEKYQINGTKVKWLKENTEHGVSGMFILTITQMNGKESKESCLVVTDFNSFTKAKIDPIKQCRLDYMAIPETVGSMVKLDELISRCYKIQEDFSYFRDCFRNPENRNGRCNDELISMNEKFMRIQAIEKKSQDVALEQRRSNLLAGKEKIQDFKDAWLVYKPDDHLGSIIVSPMLTPDNKIYGGQNLVLDAQEGKNLLRGKIEGEGLLYYIYLRTNAKTTIFHPEKLRIGAAIGIVGRYVNNMTYTTVAGAEKLAPVLDVMFIE